MALFEDVRADGHALAVVAVVLLGRGGAAGGLVALGERRAASATPDQPGGRLGALHVAGAALDAAGAPTLDELVRAGCATAVLQLKVVARLAVVVSAQAAHLRVHRGGHRDFQQ